MADRQKIFKIYLKLYLSMKKLSLYTIIIVLLAALPAALCAQTGGLLLDLRFNSDGTAYDASPMQMGVETINSGGVSTYYNNTYQCYTASFTNPWSGTPSGYYKINYENNEAFKQALQDGHSMECLLVPVFSTLGTTEVKPFASHQAGGTGFLVCTPSSGGGSNQFTFLPNTTDSKKAWRWALSGITPVSNTYYHLIGVWDKEAGKARIYVNGELKNEVDAGGTFNLPSSGSQWFAVGCDAAPSAGTNAWAGDIVTARVWDKALTQANVDSLWAIVRDQQDQQKKDFISAFSFLSGLGVNGGMDFPVKGTGFLEGDSIRLQSVAPSDTSFLAPIKLTTDGITFSIPQKLKTGSYRLIVVRGKREQDLGVCAFTMLNGFPKGAQVVAHRGWWTKDGGTSQNSRLSLQNALDAGFYGSETDVWITSDGVVVVNHNSSIGGVTIQTSPHSALSSIRLTNNETVPTLEDFLDQLAASKTQTKLIIEIKTHSSQARNYACCDSVVSAVKRRGLQSKVEYIAYSIDNCRRLVWNDSTAMVQYLNGDLGPATLHSYAVMGMDYTKAQFQNNPTWVSGAHERGMITNAYTINAASEMAEVNNMNIDFITTNYPDQAQEIYEYYSAHGYVAPNDTTEAYYSLRDYVRLCEADTTDYSDTLRYDAESVAKYTRALNAARNALNDIKKKDLIYTTLQRALANARNGIARIYPIGDVNRDDHVDSSDVAAVYNFINYGESGSGLTLEQTDLTKDGIITSADIVIVYNSIQARE